MAQRVQREPELLRRAPGRSFEELAADQGVAPVLDFESLIGHPAPEDETAEEFSALLRVWRRETADASGPDEPPRLVVSANLCKRLAG